jgi:hypothetical protein
VRILVFIAFSLAARAQLALVTCDNTPAAPVQSTYSFGSVAVGTSEMIDFCVVNNGTTNATIAVITLSGAGFSFAAGTTAPAGFLLVPGEASPVLEVVFTPSATLATYSASLVITPTSGNPITVVFLATAVAAPTVSFEPPCSLAGANTVNFGTLVNGSQHGCNFSILNGNAQPLVISTIAVTGAFQGAQMPATPLTLAPGQATDFAIDIAPACGTTSVSGKLTINSTAYTLTGAPADPPLPAATLSVNGSAASGQQDSVSLSIATPAACAAKGNVNLEFTPAAKLPVSDDASIVFLAGSTRSLPFSVAAGSSSVLINGQPSAAFQTGTTAGTITFSVGGIPTASTAPLSITIPPAPISIETAAASNQITGQLDIEIVGFDNTYSAGPMSFTFADSNGKQIGAAVTADFTSNFSSYFSAHMAGSAFLIRISFPVTGNASVVATVAASLNNSAGPAQTGTLAFQ